MLPHVTSSHVMSRHARSCHVMSRHVTSCHVLPRYVTLCQVMSRHVTSCHVGCPKGCRYHTASAVYNLVCFYIRSKLKTHLYKLAFPLEFSPILSSDCLPGFDSCWRIVSFEDWLVEGLICWKIDWLKNWLEGWLNWMIGSRIDWGNGWRIS